ncbi:MAG: quinone-dependent dihydroorotate dehydrogenase [Proteobacteria bacterium]|nr:quinone-dependent dihydroorotate dehydrogenase [Pseudomonadota bacterium]
MDLYRFVLPALRLFDPETAHGITVRALELGLAGASSELDSPRLRIKLWGKTFSNPIGLAAGFDKDARVINALLSLGFGFVEAGTVTPKAQPGNPRPRIFRLSDDRAVINRLGFNSPGLEPFVEKLRSRNPQAGGLVGANIGANRGSPDPVEDYATGFSAVAGLVDYVTVNISSPNTPGLRDLQKEQALSGLLDRLVNIRANMVGDSVPIVVKIAPDLDDDEVASIAQVVLDKQIDGIIVSNTTVARPPQLRGRHRDETGGLSGVPLRAPSTALLAKVFRLTGGRIPLIGVGGIASGEDVYAKIRAGASLVQLYTALVYEGPGLISKIKHDLDALLERDGAANAAAMIGHDVQGL